MDVFNKYNFFSFRLFDTNINLIFDENFLRTIFIPPVPIPHYHEVWELYCVSNGILEIKVLEEHYTIKKNQVFVIPPRTKHHLVSGSEDLHHTSIRFFISAESDLQEKSVNKILKGTNFSVFSLPLLDVQLLEQLKESYQKFLESNSKDPWLQSRTSTIAMHFFISVLGIISETKHIPLAVQRQKESYGLMLIEYLMLYGQENLTLGQIAQMLNYSETHTARIIKKKFGKTFRNMISEIRLEKACFHLIETDNSIESISSSLGFKNPNSFFSSFKNAKGISPSEYRKLYRIK